jgi:hypothetical protein
MHRPLRTHVRQYPPNHDHVTIADCHNIAGLIVSVSLPTELTVEPVAVEATRTELDSIRKSISELPAKGSVKLIEGDYNKEASNRLRRPGSTRSLRRSPPVPRANTVRRRLPNINAHLGEQLEVVQEHNGGTIQSVAKKAAKTLFYVQGMPFRTSRHEVPCGE